MDSRELFFYLNLVDTEIYAYDTNGITKNTLYKIITKPFESILSAFLSDCLNRDYNSIYKPYTAFTTKVNLRQLTTLQSYDLRQYELDFIRSTKAVVIKGGTSTKLYDGDLFDRLEISVDYNKLVNVQLVVLFNESLLNTIVNDKILPVYDTKNFNIVKEVFGDAR